MHVYMFKPGKKYMAKHKGGGYMRHTRLKHEGLGISGDMYKHDKGRNPIENLTREMNYLTIQKPKSKKYISLNL